MMKQALQKILAAETKINLLQIAILAMLCYSSGIVHSPYYSYSSVSTTVFPPEPEQPYVDYCQMLRTMGLHGEYLVNIIWNTHDPYEGDLMSGEVTVSFKRHGGKSYPYANPSTEFVAWASTLGGKLTVE